MTTIERILQLQEESGLNNKALEAAVGLANGSITSWKKGRCSPSAEAIVKLAQFFHVTTDYLLGVSDSRVSELVISLSPKEQILIDAYRSASDEGQFNIIQVCMNEKEKAENLTSVG